MKRADLAAAIDRSAALAMMIRVRVRYGYVRWFRLFYAMSEPENASARNVRDEGFVTRFAVRNDVRELS